MPRTPRPGAQWSTPDTGSLPEQGGPIQTSQVMRWVDARTSGLAAMRECGDITCRSASSVRGDHVAIAGIPSGAEGERYQPFSVVPQAGMNGYPAAGDSPAAVQH